MVDHHDIVELSDAELDLVAGGHGVAGGLVNVVLTTDDITILQDAFNDIQIDVIDDVTIKNVANNNNISVGAIIQALGGGAAIVQRQV